MNSYTVRVHSMQLRADQSRQLYTLKDFNKLNAIMTLLLIRPSYIVISISSYVVFESA